MRLQINVPATSANIGSGFDAVGLALKRYNFFDVTFLDNGFSFEGVEERFCNENHLFIETLFKTIDTLGGTRPNGLHLRFKGDVPVSNGLGSSSTCIVAGVAAALMYVHGEVDTQKLLDISVLIEGHPDNVAPAILGGIVAGVLHEGRFLHVKESLSDVYCYITITPDFEFPTSVARAALPKALTYEQAIFNLSRAALLLPAFKREDDQLIQAVTQDSIHQQYRIDMMEEYHDVMSFLDELPLVTSFLSGAGATLCLVIRKEKEREVLELLGRHQKISQWDVRSLEAENSTLNIQQII